MTRTSLTIFTVLVQQYYPVLHRFARFVIKNNEAAEDIASATLVSCWKNREDLSTAEDIHNYLKKKTLRLCHTWLHSMILEHRRHNHSI